MSEPQKIRFSDFVNTNRQLFDQHNFIKFISDKPCWTLNGFNKKIPIDAVKYLKTGKAEAASYPYEQRTVTLNQLRYRLPKLNSFVYQLDCRRDGFMVLDIEPDCPDHLQEEFLKMPYIYAEKSLSGKGFHLVMPMPESFDRYPEAQDMAVLKDPSGHFEILMTHWVTFTGNAIENPFPYERHSNRNQFSLLFEGLAKNKRQVENQHAHLKELPKVETIPSSQAVIHELVYGKPVYDTKKSRVTGDPSREDFRLICFLFKKMDYLQNRSYLGKITKWTEEEKIQLVYAATEAMIGYRNEVKGNRRGIPYLLHVTYKAYDQFKANQGNQNQPQPAKNGQNKPHTYQQNRQAAGSYSYNRSGYSSGYSSSLSKKNDSHEFSL